MNGPTVGVFYHWLGGLAAASFYIPYKGVRSWSWETYWLVGGFFSWIIAPWALAALLVPDLLHTLLHAPVHALAWAAFFGTLWGVGGLTFGLSVRYMGVALGYAVALGCCAVFGTLIPPIFDGSIRGIAAHTSGRFVLLGVAICVLGIIVSCLAGISKDRDVAPQSKSPDAAEFNLFKGLGVAVFAGVLSACMSFALTAGKPIAHLARESLAAHGGSDLWQNLPVLIVVLLGGFCTNFVWCVYLNLKNRSALEYIGFQNRQIAEIAAVEAVMTGPQASGTIVETTPIIGQAPLLKNYTLSAIAGVTWYMQFFFYSMGQTKMGKFDFSSWTLHMASIILFSTLWGIALKEWNGTSRRTKSLVGIGIFVLVLSTVVIGLGNYLGSQQQS